MTLKMCKDLQGPKVEQRLLEFPTFIFDLKLEASNTNAEHRLMVNQSYTGFFVHNKKIMCGLHIRNVGGYDNGRKYVHLHTISL